MIRRALKFLAIAIAFTSSMRMWQYHVGVRLQIFDLLLLLFLAGFITHTVLRRRIPRTGPAWQRALLAKWLILGISLLTCLQLDATLAPAASMQFSKGIAAVFLHTAGLTALVLFLHEEHQHLPNSVLRAYLGGAVVSSIYSFFEVTCAYLGFDLGRTIFLTISIYPPDFDQAEPFFYQWDNFFRAAGFTGVNTQATFVAVAVPILLVASPFRRRWVSLSFAACCLAGSALTLSRNGFFTLCLIGAGYMCFQPLRALKLMPKLLLALIPLVAVFFAFKDGATQLVATRLGSSFSELATSRSDIVQVVWPVAQSKPFTGFGLNQFSVVMAHSTRFDVSDILAKYPTHDEEWVRQSYANVHNNWLNWFFEGGLPLALAHLLEYAMLVLICLRGQTRLGMVSAATLCALMISGFFNMTLDLFSTELLSVLLPVCVALATTQPPPASAAAPSIQVAKC